MLYYYVNIILDEPNKAGEATKPSSLYLYCQ